MRKFLRRARWGFFAVSCLVAILLLGGWVWLRSSLPTLDGTASLPGLAAPVEVVRDENAVPHIFASSAADAYAALGYVHAQDRLWQMETQRRAGAGRMAELVGAPALGWDRFARTLGLYRKAEASLAYLAPELRAALDAYARGVNAFIDGHAGAWPPEFVLLGAKPEPWRPADSLVWGRLMAIQLSGNWRNELLRARILARLGAARTAMLFPDYPAGAPVTHDGGETRDDARARGGLYDGLYDGGLYDGRALDRLWAALPDGELLGPGASNEWVVAGSRTASGKPVLANDPHLGLSAPILWYLARIEAPGLSLAGVTVPGTPVHILGHNGRIAWGFTTAYADTDDIFVERIDPADPTRYLAPGAPGGSLPFMTRTEIIKIKDAEPETLIVRETRHGPVLDNLATATAPDMGSDGGTVLALSAPWLRDDDRTAEGLYRLNRAGNWREFTAALALFGGPVQNIAYADTAGNIGLYTPGLVPIRKKGEGYGLAPGWTGEYDWSGFIPFADLPQRLNPPGGLLINANNRLVDDTYPYFFSREWGGPRRARRIADLLEQAGLGKAEKYTPEAAAAMQADTVSYAARDMLPLMLAAVPDEPRAQAAAALLRAWDWRMDRDRPEPLVFTAWFGELNRMLYADELGPLADSYWGLRPDVVREMLTNGPAWCDDVGTEAVETCRERIGAALVRALDTLAEAYGSEMNAWRWGEAHYADLRHRVFNFVPVLRTLANIRLPADGGSFTLNRGAIRIRDGKAPFADRHGAGFRGVYDLADLAASRFIIASGQSGNPLSPHYDDLAERWRDVDYIRLAGTRDEVAARGVGVLRLEPSGKGGQQ